MDCVEGMKNDCTCITKDQLGKRFFYYVKDLKARNMEKFKLTKEQEDDMFPYVGDEDVVVGWDWDVNSMLSWRRSIFLVIF